MDQHILKHHIAKRLKQARQSCKLKQEAVALQVGLTASMLSALECGKRRMDAITLFQLASLYQKPLEWFFSTHPECDPDLDAIQTKAQQYKVPVDWKDPLCVQGFTLLINAPQALRDRALAGLIGFLQG